MVPIEEDKRSLSQGDAFPDFNIDQINQDIQEEEEKQELKHSSKEEQAFNSNHLENMIFDVEDK